MLSEQPGKEIFNNPKSEFDPDEPMVYQIRVKLGNYWPKTTYERLSPKWRSSRVSFIDCLTNNLRIAAKTLPLVSEILKLYEMFAG